MTEIFEVFIEKTSNEKFQYDLLSWAFQDGNTKMKCFIKIPLGFPGGSAVKHLPAVQEMRVQSLDQEDPPIPRSGKSLEGMATNPLQYSCLENPMDRGAWRATVHRIAKS